MEKYLGVKLVEAEPMNKYEFYMNIKGIDCKEDNAEGYMVKYPDGYESWSPKEVFEEAYRRIDNLTFGLAIEALKKGYRVARKGWNGKKMWLILVNANEYELEAYKYFNAKSLAPYIAMKTADEQLVPWLASQTDVLAEDWMVIE